MEFVSRYKNQILRITLIVLFVAFIGFSWGHWGHVTSDSFREAIIPESMLDGKVLYRDILNLYPPFAYQVNALLFKIFGCNLNVLYIAGIACSATVLTFLYKLISKYSSETTAFVTTLTVMELLTFRICIKNSAAWFFPYSYSFLYAFTLCFVAICLYLLMKKGEDKNNFSKMAIISLLIGFSIASKWDFLLIALVPLFEAVKNKSIKEFAAYFGLMLLPSLLSFGLYLLFGGTVLDLANQVKFLSDFAHSPSVIAFNKYFMPQSITPSVIHSLSVSLGLFAEQFAVILLFFWIVVSVFRKLSEKPVLKGFTTAILLLIGWIFIFQPFSVAQFQKAGLNDNIVFVPYLLAVWAIATCGYKFYKKQKFSEEEKFCIELIIFGFLMTFRNFAEVKISYIGNFTIVLYWAAFVYFLAEILPKYFEKLQNYKSAINLSLIGFCLTITSVYFLYFLPNMNFKINGTKGSFYTSMAYSQIINEAMDYINKNVPENNSVLVLEEGLIINWFTNRETDLNHYALIPHVVDTLGENNIIDSISKNKPDYIMITNNSFPQVGEFGIGYAKDITAYIFDNYDYEKSIVNPKFKNGFEIAILKKKQ